MLYTFPFSTSTYMHLIISYVKCKTSVNNVMIINLIDLNSFFDLLLTLY